MESILGIRAIEICVIPDCMQLVTHLEKNIRLFSQFWTCLLSDWAQKILGR